MEKILVIDGQGGKIGRMVVELLKERLPACEVCAVGTNSIATAAMLKAGADYGATGENPVAVNAADADIIIGPLGLLVADALHGEVTLGIVASVGRSRAQKVLIPVSRCGVQVAGSNQLPPGELIAQAVSKAAEIITG